MADDKKKPSAKQAEILRDMVKHHSHLRMGWHTFSYSLMRPVPGFAVTVNKRTAEALMVNGWVEINKDLNKRFGHMDTFWTITEAGRQAVSPEKGE